MWAAEGLGRFLPSQMEVFLDSYKIYCSRKSSYRILFSLTEITDAILVISSNRYIYQHDFSPTFVNSSFVPNMVEAVCF